MSLLSTLYETDTTEEVDDQKALPDETIDLNVSQDKAEDDQDPNRVGAIRIVPKAHLIYKRTTEEGEYEELWIYNISDDLVGELDIKQDILAGTDIQANSTSSADGAQSFAITTMGNAQFLYITGLPQ